jgi:subtilase family serine protease
MKTRNLIVVAAIALALGGCGGGGGTTSAAANPNSTPSAAPTTSPAANAEPMMKSFAKVGTGRGNTLSPLDVTKHYNMPTTLTGAGQVIAIVDAPGSSTFAQIVTDLNTFSNYYNLPSQNATNTIVTHIDLSNGSRPAFNAANDWIAERNLDVQWAHAIAPQAKIILVTSKTNSASDMQLAVQTASLQPGVTAISLSYGAREFSAETGAAYDGLLKTIQAKGIAVFVASGDSGNVGNFSEWPSTSPYVTSVGGTVINTTAALTPTLNTEVVWAYGGGGTSLYELLPAYQTASIIGATDVALNTGKKRLVPDVSYNADVVSSPVAFVINGLWYVGGGTSAGAPQWAAITAMLAQNRVNLKKTSMQTLLASTPGGLNGILYQTKLDTAAMFDVRSGNNNGTGKACAICNAGVGYDAATGLGVPNVTSLVAFF